MLHQAPHVKIVFHDGPCTVGRYAENGKQKIAVMEVCSAGPPCWSTALQALSRNIPELSFLALAVSAGGLQKFRKRMPWAPNVLR